MDQDTYSRRPPPDGRHPDQRLEERGAAAHGGKPADRRDADPHQPAAPQRHHHHGGLLAQHGVDIALNGNGEWRSTRAQKGPCAGAYRRQAAREQPGALRPGAQDAGRSAGARAAGGARRAKPRFRCPAAAPSAPGRSTCTSRAWSSWAPRSS